jgi:tape measure domain-containing protein
VAEGKGGNVASVGLSLDSSAFNSGVARALADISRLLTGLRELQAASQKTNLGQLGVGGRAGGASGAFTPAGFARDIQRLAIPALRQLDRTAAASPLLGGRMARNAGFDPVAMATAINRQTIPAMQRLSRTMSGLRDSSDFMKEFEAGRAARERAHRAMLERESRITQEIARGTTKRLEREQARMIQARRAENLQATDPNTQGSRQLRAAIEMRRQLAEQKRYIEANPTPTQTRYAGGGRGGGSREGRWGDVSDLKGIPKDWRNVLMQLEQQGWRIEGRPSGHPVAKPVNREFKPITFPGTPSDARALQNFISLARKAGGVINGRGYRDEGGPFVERQRGLYEDPSTKRPTLRANYRMAALEELVTSNLPGYPPVMQPRPRGVSGLIAGDPNSQKLIENMIKGFKRSEVFAPTGNLEEGLIATVANAAGKQFVASGNARTMALQALAKQGVPHRNAISGFSMEYLKSNPTEFGEGEVAALKKAGASIARSGKTPMLIREIAGGVEGLTPQRLGQLGLQLNARTGLSESEIAIAASRMLPKLPAEVLAGDPRKIVAAGKGPAYEALKSALSSEVLGEHVMGTRYKGASGGVAFKGMMEQMLYARAYGNNPATAQMLTAAFSGEPSEMSASVRAALGRSLGPQLRLRERINAGEVPAGMDPIFNSLPGALQLMQRALGTGGQGAGWINNPETLQGNPSGALRALLSQKTLFGDPTTPIERRLAANMLAVGPKGLSPFLSSLGMYGSRAEGAQMGMFGAQEGGLLQATSNPRQAIALAQKAAAQYQEALKTDPAMKGTSKAAVAAREAALTSIVEGVYAGMPAQAAAVAQKVATSSPQAAAAGEGIVQGAAAAVTQAAARPKGKRFTFRITEEEQAAFLSKIRGPVVSPASQGGGYQVFPPEEPRAEPRTGLRRPNAQRMTELGGYGISPREIGVAEGSIKARAGGYLPYSESSPQRQTQYNNRLASGYVTLMSEIEGHLGKPGPVSTAALAAKIPEVERLYKVAMERGLGMDPMNAHAGIVARGRAIIGPTEAPNAQVAALTEKAKEATKTEAVAATKAAEAGTKTAKAKEKVAKEEERVLTGGAGGGGRGRPTALSGAGGGDPTNPYLAASGGRAILARLRSSYNMSVAGLNAKTGKYLVDPNESVLNVQKAAELRGQMRALMSSPEFQGLSTREKARQVSMLSEKFSPLRSVQGEKLASTNFEVQSENGPAGMQRFASLLRPFLETYVPARRLTGLQLAESQIKTPQGTLHGMYNTGENSMLLAGLRNRSSGAVLRTMVHELSHGQFEERMKQGYVNPAQIPQIDPKGQIVRNASGHIQYMPHALAAAKHGEPMSAGHLDPEFYRLQAATSKSSGALTAQLAFHRLMGEAIPGGFTNSEAMSKFGVGKEAGRLLPELQKAASPQQVKNANNFLELIKTIYTKLGSTSGKGLGGLQRYAQRSFGSAIGVGLLPEGGGLQAAAHIGNYLGGLKPEDFKGKNIESTKMGFLGAAAQATTSLIGPESQLARPMQEISRARSEVAKYLVGLSPMEKGMIALGMDPSAFVKAPGAKPFFDPKNVEHVEKANRMVRQLVRSFQEVSKAEVPAAERLVTQGRVSTGTGRGTRELPMRLENVPHTAIPGGVVLQGARPGGPGQPGSFTGGGALVPYNPETAAESIRRYYAQSLVAGGGLSGRFFRGVGMERLMMPQQQIRENFGTLGTTLRSSIYNSPLGAPVSQYRQSRENYMAQNTNAAEMRKGAKANYQMQVMETEAMQNAQTRLNRVMGTGTINFNQLGKVLTEVGNGFTAGAMSSLRFAANLAIGQQAVFAFVGMINHLRGGIIEFNAKLEAAAVGFKTLFVNAGYSVSEAEAKTAGFIQTLREFANVTNFRFGDLQTAALRMKAFGFEIDNATAAAKNQMPILEAIPNPWNELTGGAKEFRGAIVNIGDAVAALGAEDDKLRRVTYALGQMNSAGRVYQNDMMQLANAGIAGYDILAKAVRKQLENNPELMRANKAIYSKLLNPRTAVEEIRKLARVGRLVGPEAVQAILKGLGEQYGGGMQAYSRTFQGAMTTLADTSQSLIATSFKPMFDMVRNFTVQLADAFQTSAWTSNAESFAQVIQKVANALAKFIPGAANTTMKIVGSFFDTFGKLGSAVASTSSSLGNMTSNFAKGLATIGDLLQNDVIRNLLVAGVTAKLVLSTIASNPLLATIGLVVTSIGAITQAVQSNAFGFGDLFNQVKPQLDKILNNISTNFVPGVTEGLTSGLDAFFVMMGAFIRSVTPLFLMILDILSKVGQAVKPFANVLGMALAAFVTKKVLIDGMAAAMGRFANATGAAGAAMKMLAGGGLGIGSSMGMGAFGASRRFYGAGRLVGLATQEATNPLEKLLMGGNGVMSAGAAGAGMGYGSPALMRAARHILPRYAEEQGMQFTGAGMLRSGNALTPEAAGLVLSKYQEAVANRGTRQGDADYKRMERAIGKKGMAELQEQSKLAQQGAIAALGQFAMKLKSTGLSLETLKLLLKEIGRRMAGMGQAVMGIGMGMSVLGSALHSEGLTKLGDGLTQIGFAVSGLAMAFNALKAAFPAMSAGLFAVILAITALVGFLMDQQVTQADRDKASKYRKVYAARDQLISAYGEDAAKKMYPDLFPEGGVTPLPAESKTKTQIIPEYYKRFGVTQEILDAAMGDTTNATLEAGKWLEGVDANQLERALAESDLSKSVGEWATSLFKQGYKPEEIAKMTGMSLEDVTAKFKKFYETTGTAGQELIAQVLSESMDATGTALKEAQDAYQKALEPFQTSLNRLTSRTQEVMQEMFDAEKKALENEKQAALENTMVMYNGEQVRLGVLEQQYDAMKQQREEMDKMAELEKQRTAAAEAALDVFDASVAPLERARKAREAARDLFSQMGTNRLDQMSKAIEAGKGGVAYTETSSYYEDKAKALTKDQAERMRTVQEQLDDLMKKISEGKIGTTAAKAKFKDIFAQAGLDLDIAQTQGYQFMSSFGDGFMNAMNDNISSVFSKLPGLILKGIEVAKQDAAYKKAQDFYNDMVNPQTKITGKEYKDKYVSKMLASATKIRDYGRTYLTTGAGKNLFADPKERDNFIAKMTEKVTNLQNIMNNVADDAVISGTLAKSVDSGFNNFFGGMLGLPNGDQLLDVLTRIYGMRGEGRPGEQFLPNYVLPGGAAGGTITTAGQFMVGERGPEMVEVGPNGIRVVPNHKLPSWLRSSAGALGAVNMGLRGFGSGTSSPWDDIMAGTPMIASASGVKKAGKLEDYLMMIAATLAPELIGGRAGLAGLGKIGSRLMGKAGNSAVSGMEWMLGDNGPLAAIAGKLVSMGSGINNVDPNNLGPKMKLISTLLKPQMKMIQFAGDVGYEKILSMNFLKSMGAAGGTIGLSGLESQGLFGMPGFIADMLRGGTKGITPPRVNAHPTRSSINGTVNIHNPQLNSAADINRLADRVAEAQARALRSSGYVKR